MKTTLTDELDSLQAALKAEREARANADRVAVEFQTRFLDELSARKLAEAENATLRGLAQFNPDITALLKDVMDQHSNPVDAFYNGCDKDRCQWCEDAAAILASPLLAESAAGEKP